MKIIDLVKSGLEQLNPDGLNIDPAKASPFPPLELIGEKLTSPIRPGVPDLIEGFMPKRGQLVIAGETNVGKAQPLDALVLTPTGWAQMGNLRLGDSIINPHGGTSTIVGVYPQGLKQVYRVTLTDGRSTEACAEHLWEVYHPNWARLESGYKVLSTQQLTELTPKYRKRVCVDTPTETNFGMAAELPIHPWRLLKIKSIEPTRITETQCIRVDNSGGLYVTNDFIVTHNTTIALEIVSSLTTGAPLWKEKKPTEVIGRVLYVLGEHYNDIVKGLWHRMGVPMGDDVWILGPEQLTVDKWLVQSGKQNPLAISKLIKWAEGADLIVFDPLSAFLTGSDAENDNIQMRLVLDSMSLIAQSVNASCLVLAHQGKPAVGKDGQEYARTKYAIRGASAIEDAATNIFYMSRVMGASQVAETRDSKVFEMRNRKYKGDAPEKYELVKDPHNLTHTLLGNRPYIQVRQMETQALYGRLQSAFPEASVTDILKMVSVTQSCSEATVRRALGHKD